MSYRVMAYTVMSYIVLALYVMVFFFVMACHSHVAGRSINLRVPPITPSTTSMVRPPRSWPMARSAMADGPVGDGRWPLRPSSAPSVMTDGPFGRGRRLPPAGPGPPLGPPFPR